MLLFIAILVGCGGSEVLEAEAPPPAEPIERTTPTTSTPGPSEGVSRTDDPASTCGYAFEESHSQAAHSAFAEATNLDCEYDGVYTAGAALEVRWKAKAAMASMKLAPGGCHGGEAAATVVVDEVSAKDCPKAFSAAREIVKAGTLPAPVALQ